MIISLFTNPQKTIFHTQTYNTEMPEGHTIHRIAKDLSKRLLRQRLAVSSPQGRFRSESDRLSGGKLRKVFAHGKHLFCEWNTGEILHIHLGLYGKFRFHKLPVPEPKGQVRVRMIGEKHAVDLNGPNQCELISSTDLADKLGSLGEDPLQADANVDRVWQKVSRSRAAIGTLLLNQSVIAGVGNVYRAEVLYWCGLAPDLPANQLTEQQFLKIWETLQAWLKIGVKYNRIITTDLNKSKKAPSRLTKTERLMIYKKQTCEQCEAEVAVMLSGNRKLYYCPQCQSR